MGEHNIFIYLFWLSDIYLKWLSENGDHSPCWYVILGEVGSDGESAPFARAESDAWGGP